MSADQPPPEARRPPQSLRREIGVFGATMMGLGSIVGSGIFIGIGTAAASAGPAVILAMVVAALVAACNGLSSAQLAAAHPVSGGAYEYGYRWLHPSLGFTAGWMFICAKSASAATAALGFAGYALNAFGRDGPNWRISLALSAVVLLAATILLGIRRSSLANIAIVSIALLSLVFFVVAGIPAALRLGAGNLTPFFSPASAGHSALSGFLESCALMFVAYTGYGRIATLGEEVREPRKNIPISIIVTLLVSTLLYVLVGTVAIATVGSEALAAATQRQAAPLEFVARRFDVSGAANILAIGAIASMLGVLLNLILGLSRVVLAMGRRGDLPAFFARLDRTGTTPSAAVIGVSLAIAGLVLLGDVKTTWSFSAFTVLIYYALTNLAAIRMRENERLYPRAIPWCGLLACSFLAFWVERSIWMIGAGLIAGGLVWWRLASRLARSDR